MEKLQAVTVKKIEEVQAMIDAGATEKEIIKEKFKSSPKAFNDWTGKKYLKWDNVEAAIVEREPAAAPPLADMGKMQVLEKVLNNADILLELMANGKDLLSLLSRKQDVEEINILQIPEEILSLKDISSRSYRVSDSLDAELNDLVAANKPYTKTALINYAISELIKKYKQN